MKELKMICSAAQKMKKEGLRVAMATVVAVRGSAYRRSGARMVVAEDGRSYGMIGGGCFDADVKELATEVLETGIPRLRLYDMADDHVWGLGLGCNGSVYVLIESLSVALGEELLEKINESLMKRTGLQIQHHFSKPLDFNFEEDDYEITIKRTYQEVHSKIERNKPTDKNDTFYEYQEPAPRLVIFGAGHDVIPVVDFASQAGFDVTVVDQRPVFLSHDRFPRAEQFIHSRPDEYEAKLRLHLNDYVLFMSHRIDFDAQAFLFCSQHPVKYFGFLGPKRRAEKIIKEFIKMDDLTLNRIQNRIFSPIGLDLGAETAEEVAFSIVSELLAIKNGRHPNFLREKNGNIHERLIENSPPNRGLKNQMGLKRARVAGKFVCSI
jgi:xanthine dehydrogenase accessory factor